MSVVTWRRYCDCLHVVRYSHIILVHITKLWKLQLVFLFKNKYTKCIHIFFLIVKSTCIWCFIWRRPQTFVQKPLDHDKRLKSQNTRQNLPGCAGFNPKCSNLPLRYQYFISSDSIICPSSKVGKWFPLRTPWLSLTAVYTRSHHASVRVWHLYRSTFRLWSWSSVVRA